MVKKLPIDLGLINRDQYSDTGIDLNEVERAKYLIEGLVEPATGFEMHFLKCWNKQAIPACPKEMQLLRLVSQSIAYDEAIGESAFVSTGEDCMDSYGNTAEDYAREDEQRTRELVSELDERTRIRRGLKPVKNQMNVTSTRQIDDKSIKATQDASRSELIKSYHDWVNSSDNSPFVS